MIYIKKFIRKWWSGYCICKCKTCINAPIGKEEEHCLNESNGCKFKWND